MSVKAVEHFSVICDICSRDSVDAFSTIELAPRTPAAARLDKGGSDWLLNVGGLDICPEHWSEDECYFCWEEGSPTWLGNCEGCWREAVALNEGVDDQ